MTSSLLRPRRRARAAAAADGAVVTGSTAPTRILDWRDPRVAALVRELGAAPAGGAAGESAESADLGESAAAARQVEALHRAHRWIAATVRPVYSVQDERPVSEVLRLGRGSCSQRMAVLEAVARASGVPTRVRGLLVDGTFWYPRFPRLRRIVPDQVLLAWPEFRPGVPPRPGSRSRNSSAGCAPWAGSPAKASPTPGRRPSSRRCPGRRSTGTRCRSARARAPEPVPERTLGRGRGPRATSPRTS